MGQRIHHHTITTILIGAEFGNFAKFLGHSGATNYLKVHWLRFQTHMEWFSHLLHTYKRCFRIFIWSGWADRSTIMPLPPYILALNSWSMQISCITSRLYMISSCIGWGYKPTWNGSHFHSIHIQGVWDHSYGVDGRMDPLSCHFHHTCWHRAI